MMLITKRYYWLAIQVLAISQLCHGYPNLIRSLNEQTIDVDQLEASYDYIVVGGGQSGLVIGNRLSEDVTSKSK